MNEKWVIESLQAKLDAHRKYTETTLEINRSLLEACKYLINALTLPFTEHDIEDALVYARAAIAKAEEVTP